MVPNPSTRVETTQPDELDDLFNYDPGMDDVFKETSGATEDTTTSTKDTANGPAGLGIDEEVKITKKRQPIAKLDETRLLSTAGIPKLRRISKDRLRFRGKGHEFSDIARLLNMYQLWLDDLYPRAKFADGLTIVEKLGHTKRMQMMRKQWIDEGKPKGSVEDDRNASSLEDGQDNAETVQAVEKGQTCNATARRNSPSIQTEHAAQGTRDTADIQEEPRQAHDSGGEPDEDELDALLAEEPMRGNHLGVSLFGGGPASTSARSKHHGDDEFADEMEIMAGMGDVWHD